MIEMTLAEVAEATGGTVLGDPRVRVTAPATLDSRAVEPGGLFVAIRGEHVDGHAYAPAALAAGAAAVLGSQPIPSIPANRSGPMVLVEDAEAALGRLAREVLRRVPDLTCLALTGSQGKTGTKDYLAAVLAGHGETVATHGNFNNELGVPLTVLRTTPTTRYLVVEMGARGIGHIAQLCAIAPPQVAACLNVGTAHLGEFGGREQIAQAKGEILEALPASGVGVLNADDPAVAAMARRTDAATVTFGTGATADVRYEITGTDPLGRPAVALTHAGRSVQVQLPQIGGFQAANAAAAAAMALAVGMPLDGVAAGLAEAGASPWRMEVHERPDGTVLLNDAYNANPQSMAAALDTLARVGEVRGARTLAVLGEMGELGDAATEEHVRLGAYAAQQGVDVVLAVGTIAADVARGTAQHPSWGGVVVSLGSTTDALAWLRESMRPEDVVLFKASRAAGLEVLATTVAREEETDR